MWKWEGVKVQRGSSRAPTSQRLPSKDTATTASSSAPRGAMANVVCRDGS